MDLGNLGATFEANKVPILAVAGAGVVGLALVRKSKTARAGGDGQPAPDGGSGYSAGGQTSGMGGAYDSSASDLYGAIQPQLEALGGQIGNLQDQLNGKTTPPVPVPAHPVTTLPVGKPRPAPTPKAKPPVPVASPHYAVDTWYTVRAGDTLSGIAARFPQQSITAGSIYNANKATVGSNINAIRPGQRLHVFGN